VRLMFAIFPPRNCAERNGMSLSKAEVPVFTAT
jgi:hypothetical protein